MTHNLFVDYCFQNILIWNIYACKTFKYKFPVWLKSKKAMCMNPKSSGMHLMSQMLYRFHIYTTSPNVSIKFHTYFWSSIPTPHHYLAIVPANECHTFTGMMVRLVGVSDPWSGDQLHMDIDGWTVRSRLFPNRLRPRIIGQKMPIL